MSFGWLPERVANHARRPADPRETEHDDRVRQLRVHGGADQQDLLPEEQLQREPPREWYRRLVAEV